LVGLLGWIIGDIWLSFGVLLLWLGFGVEVGVSEVLGGRVLALVWIGVGELRDGELVFPPWTFVVDSVVVTMVLLRPGNF
jgi:hypothetical protein